MLTAVLVLIGLEYLNLRRAILEDSQVEAAIVAENVSTAVLFADSRACREIAQGLHSSPSVQNAAIFDIQDKLLAEISTVPTERTPTIQPSLRQKGSLFSTSQLEIFQPVRHQGKIIGHIYVSKSLNTLRSRLAVYALGALAVAASAILLAFILVGRIRKVVIRAEDRLHTLAHVDPVTGLANRNAFQERIDFALLQAQRFDERFALMMLDLDNFKSINDTLGHLSGDELLRMVAGRLKEALRRDDIVSRQGGDEFAILIRISDAEEEAHLVADKIVTLFATPFVIDDQEFAVTASIGLALYPRDGDSLELLLRHADTAMYAAKSAGKNMWKVFLPSMKSQVQRRLQLANSLRQALENHEFSVHYQPLFDLDSGRVVGAEALLRWQSPEFGTVSPAEFIPIAEDSGHILALGTWVLSCACRDASTWNRLQPAEKPVYVAVNLSVKQLRDDSLYDKIRTILADTALAPSSLELELTESVIMENVHSQIELLRKLKNAGIRLSIDDFGTGYSSMAYLRRLPIDKLKIDRTFINDLPDREHDCAIVSAIIALGHSLGLNVVAEGVERIEQAGFLLTHRCDLIQGYLTGRPVPLADFLTLLERGRALEEEIIAAIRSR